MSCERFHVALVDRARGADPPGAQDAQGLDAHLEECPACAALLATETRLTADLKALAAAAPLPPDGAAVEARLLEAFAARHAQSRSQGVRVAWRPLAIAAALVLALAGVWQAGRWSAVPPDGANGVRASPSGRGMSGVPAPAPPSAAGSTSVSDDPAGPGSSQAGQVRRAHAPRMPVGRFDEVKWVEFVPLPAASALPPFESGRIVRVALPLASLPSFGFEVVPDAARDAIDAEVLIGQDGQPRAVRLVSGDAESRSRR